MIVEDSACRWLLQLDVSDNQLQGARGYAMRMRGVFGYVRVRPCACVWMWVRARTYVCVCLGARACVCMCVWLCVCV